MAGLFDPKEVTVPGLPLMGETNDAVQQQAQQQKQQAQPRKDAAVGFEDQILADSSRELKNSAAAVPSSTSVMGNAGRAAGTTARDYVLGGGPAAPLLKSMGWDPAAWLGLSPEEGQAIANERAKDAVDREQSLTQKQKVREALRNMSAAEAERITGTPALPAEASPIDAGAAAARDQTVIDATRAQTDEALAAAEGKAPQPTQSWLLNIIDTTVRSGLHMGVDVGNGMAGAWETSPVRQLMYAWPALMSGKSDEEIATELGKGLATAVDPNNVSLMRSYMTELEKGIAEALPGDPARAKDFTTELASGAGSFLGFLIAGYALGPGAAGGLGTFQQAGSAYKDAAEANAGLISRYLTLMMNAAGGATEGIPIDRMFMRAEAATGGAVSRYFKNMLPDSIEEAVQEVLQNAGEDFTAKYIAGYDPDREIDLRTYIKQGAIAGLLGAVGGGVTTFTEGYNDAVRKSKEGGQAPQQSPEQQAAEQKMSAAQQLLDDMLGNEITVPEQTDQQAPAPVPEYVPSDNIVTDTLSLLGLQLDEEAAAQIGVTEDQLNTAMAEVGITGESIGAITPDQLQNLADQLGITSLLAEGGIEGDLAPKTYKGGTIPLDVRPDGKVEIVHYSREPRDVIDPEMQGQGYRNPEAQRLTNPDAPKRTYYGVNPIDPSTFKPTDEKPFMEQTDGYQIETGVGQYRHIVAVDPNELYNWWEDPLGLKDGVDRSKPGPEQVTQFEKIIKDAGFKGIYFSRSGVGQTAYLFDKRVPEGIYYDPTQRILKGEPNALGALKPLDPTTMKWTPARPADFENLSERVAAGDFDAQNVFRRPGWAVITAIREDIGHYDHPENQKSLKQLEQELEARKIKAIPVDGAYKGVYQGRSWMIFTNEKTAAELGNKYGQESILTRKGLLYTDGTGRVVPAIHDETVIGAAAQQADFYSTFPDGSAFTMGLDFEAMPLEGLPASSTGPVETVVQAAREYAKSRGEALQRQPSYVTVDKDRARRIAAEYDKMTHAPDDPKVKAAYQAMIDETMAQYEFVKKSGLKVDVIQEGQADPYPEGPKQVLADLRDNNHLWLYPTDSGFGSSDADTSGNPLMQLTDEKIGDHQLRVNDVFRIVHDFFGHGLEGATFGARGEENAWQAHARLYSEAARPAMTSETRGQNSWVNYGPHGEANRANPRETIYADQKTGLMPEWTWQEGLDTGGGLEAMTAADVQEQNRIAARFPTQKQATEDPITEKLVIDTNAMRAAPKAFKHNMDLVRTYPNWSTTDMVRNPDKVAEQFVRKAADNLVWLYDQVPEEVRNFTKQWYDGANQIATDWGQRYELPARAVAGVIAGLSPGTNWYNNLSNAERIFDIISYHGREDWDPAMTDAAARLPEKLRKGLMDKIGGRSLEALAAQGESLDLQAMWIRIYDQAHNSPVVYKAAPTGEFLPDPWGRVQWKSTAEIVKALKIIRDPSVENISGLMGSRHKIRNFYNNIIAPSNSTDVTIDTHAVAATLLRPLSQAAPEVNHNFGNSIKDGANAKNAGISGAAGTYGLYADAYRLAAAERGVLPREMQSITWEAVRTLFTDTFKRGPGRDTVEAIWQRYKRGEIDIAQTRKEVLNAAGGINNPDWQDTGSVLDAARRARAAQTDDGAGTASYPRRVPDTAVPVWSARGDTAGARAGVPEAVPASDLEAQTSQGRQPYTAEKSRAKKGKQAPQDFTNESPGATSLRQIAQNLQNLMKLTIRQGRLTLRGPDITGQYDKSTNVVRVRNRSDLSTIVHEAGHFLNDARAAELDQFVKDHTGDLNRVAKRLYGGDLSNAPLKKVLREGFAEFFRVYVLNREFADTQYPQLTRDFDSLLLNVDPTMHAGLEAIRQQHEAYLEAPSLQVLQDQLVYTTANSGLKHTLTEMKDKGVRTWFNDIVHRFVRDSMNRYEPLYRMVAEAINIGEQKRGSVVELRGSNDPRIMARLARNSGNRATIQIIDGVIPYKSLQPATRGLREAMLVSQGFPLDANPGTWDEQTERDFDTYLVALRALAEYKRYKQGKISRPPIDATRGDVTQTIRDLNAKYTDPTTGENRFMKAAEIIDEYGRALWRKQYDAGLLDRETFLAGLDKDFYAPLQRDMSDKKSSLGDSVLTGGRTSKRFKGSDRAILSPVQVLMQKTHAVEQAIAENDTIKAMATVGRMTGAGELIEEIPAHRIIGKQYNAIEVAKKLANDNTMGATEAADLLSLVNNAYTNTDFISLFRSEQAGTLGENILFYWDGGELKALQLIGPEGGDMGRDVVDVLQGVGREQMPLFTEIVAMSSTAFRSAITSWPDFLLVNFIRDQMSAWILNDVGFVPFVSGFKGMAEEWRQKQWARDYNAASGIMGGMNSAALHDTRVNRDLNALRKRGYVAQLFGGKGFLGFAQGLTRLTEISETGTRVGLYQKAFERGKADGLTDYDAGIEAAFLATDYIDFGLNGTRMTVARRLIPFLNAQVQGLYKMTRTLGGDEVRQRKGLKYVLQAYFKDVNGLELSAREKRAIVTGRRAWAKMTAIGLIGLALTALYWDDEDYQNTSEYLRTTGWVVPLGNGRIAYIPKPFELAMVSNIMERALEAAYGDTEAKWRLLRGTAFNLTPPTSPPLIATIVEQMANRSFFTGRELVPSYMQALEPRLQYDHRTSEIAKSLGDALNLSPMIIDHYLSSLGASAYRDTRNALNALSPTYPEMDATDAFIVRRFLRDTSRGATVSQDFWDRASTTGGSYEAAYKSYKRYLAEGRELAAQQYLEGLDPNRASYAILNQHADVSVKRMHPLRRNRDLLSVISGMRRELYSDLGLEQTGKYADGPIQLSKGEKKQIDDLLSQLATRETRNTLVLLGEQGWTNKKMLPTQPTVDLLRELDPQVADEFEKRLAKARVYNFDFVAENWPDLRDRAIADGSGALFVDLEALGKAMAKIGAYN